MTGGCHIGPRLVYCRVNKEAGGISWPGRVAAHYVAIVVDQYHIRCLHGRKMLAERIRPKPMRKLYISHAYMTRHSLSEAFAREDSKSPGPNMVFPVSIP